MTDRSAEIPAVAEADTAEAAGAAEMQAMIAVEKRVSGMQAMTVGVKRVSGIQAMIVVAIRASGTQVMTAEAIRASGMQVMTVVERRVSGTQAMTAGVTGGTEASHLPDPERKNKQQEVLRVESRNRL